LALGEGDHGGAYFQGIGAFILICPELCPAFLVAIALFKVNQQAIKNPESLILSGFFDKS